MMKKKMKTSRVSVEYLYESEEGERKREREGEKMGRKRGKTGKEGENEK